MRLDNIGNECWLHFVYTLWLILNQLPQSNMLRPLGIKVFNLCIQTNSLLSLIDFDLGISLGNLIYSRMCMIILGFITITVALEMSSHCGIIVMFNVKYMTLESINDSIFCLTYILYVVAFALQTIYEIVTLACAFSYFVVGCIIVEICYLP